MTKEEIREMLFSLRDEKYADFTSGLIPTVPKESFIGVRSPALRSVAKEIYRSGDYKAFLSELPHKYYEENNLHGFIICQIKDIDECIAELRRFIPFTDNWATNDCTRPPVLKKYPEKTLKLASEYLNSEDTYTLRYGIGLLLSYFLDENFDEEHLKAVSEIISDEYYVNMMIAWYFATALAKQFEAAVPYIEKRILSPWVHNKTIQKASESYRVSEDKKAYLKSLKIKIR
ncbi:MAG: DNA alkylation repair protein [Clostridia bacterium]|nr:DNA alkylation repair protein [Clostridia bacterium]